ncbi:MAG: M2 family metallopeptidase [Planctomycetota bacterium]|nr:M2 family metallopeptidase [Planctomycetota bacterium]
MTDRTIYGMALVAIFFSGLTINATEPDSRTLEANAFLNEFVGRLQPLQTEVNLAWWDASTKGDDESFRKKQEAENRIDAMLADPVHFQRLNTLRERGGIPDRIVARRLEVLYLRCLEKQVDSLLLQEMNAKSNTIEKAFNAFRPKVGGEEISGNEVRNVLLKSADSTERQAAWEGSKGVGAVVEKDLLELVALRNRAARQLNFADYHVMKMFLSEQKQGDILKLFDELDELTREPFRKAKGEFDAKLAKHCGITVAELRPWHYHDPFFQDSPAVFGADLDGLYREQDILKLCRVFYAGIDLPIEDVLERSDLFEKPGKSPHAFCTDIDRDGDVRVLANVVPSERWMETMLHELGHAVYSSKNIPNTVPYLLRENSHILTTEGIAMMFGRLSKNGLWQEKMGVASQDPATRKKVSDDAARVLRNQLLIFSRWCQVMLRFEKGLYENPAQDLNKLWWDLVEKYQMVKRPEGRNAPDYASKIHIVVAPVYYHNYMMGELFASQLHHAIARDVAGDADPRKVIYAGDRRVGDFLKKKVFEPGATLSWNELTEFATGASLNPKAFAEDFRP